MNYYRILDPFKRLAQSAAQKTGTSVSRGESAFVWEENDCYRAFVIEGLGTKNLLPQVPYDAVAQDTVAAIVNDLITVGAKPEVINAYFAVGSPSWFRNKKRALDLVSGWAKACKLAGAVWGGGETPTLSGIIHPETIDLAGSAIGIIKPKSRLTLGDRLTAGDRIILIESSGIHANGLTLVRKLKIADSDLFRPAHIYVKFIEDVWKNGIDIHYMVNITGHGWRKLMRARKNFTYKITSVPPVPRLFERIQRIGRLTISEMYKTFNMGAGFALFVPQKDVLKTQKIAKEHRFMSWNAGVVEKGNKQVIIEPKNIMFQSKELIIR